MNTNSRIKKIEQTAALKKNSANLQSSKSVIIYDPTKPMPKPNDTGVTVFIPDNGRGKPTAKP
jgi:hypothetical protein